MKEIRQRQRAAVGAVALEFVILTVCRTNEALGMQWTEIDWEQRVWTKPWERTRAGKVHRVPLSDQAIALLARRKELFDRLRFCLHGQYAKTTGPRTAVDILQSIAPGATGTGLLGHASGLGRKGEQVSAGFAGDVPRAPGGRQDRVVLLAGRCAGRATADHGGVGAVFGRSLRGLGLLGQYPKSLRGPPISRGSFRLWGVAAGRYGAPGSRVAPAQASPLPMHSPVAGRRCRPARPRCMSMPWL